MKITNRCKLRVRYAETDKMGVVYNGEYLTYFEVGRADLMRVNGMAYREIEESGYLLPVLESYVKYRESAYYDDELEIEANLELARRPFLRFEYNILRNNTTIAEGYTVHGFMKKDTMKMVKPPREFLEFMDRMKK